jgi:Helix-turn-helix domain
MSVKQSSTSSPEIPCLLWSDKQVAAAIGMSVKRIQELARLGLLPGFKVGRNWQFDPEALRSWVRSHGVSKEA